MNDLLLIEEDIYIISGTPFILIRDNIKNRRIIVLGDLHLGQEGYINESKDEKIGLSSQKLINLLVSHVIKLGIDTIVLNGDIKHNTKGFSTQEKNEILFLIKHPKLSDKKIILIKGNHDVLLSLKVNPSSNLILSDKFCIQKSINKILIVHGHKNIIYNIQDILILSHEHPSYILRGNNKERIKLPAFVALYPRASHLIIILPAANEISSGISFPVSKDKFLSPILKKLEYMFIQIYPFEYDVGILPLPKMRYYG